MKLLNTILDWFEDRKIQKKIALMLQAYQTAAPQDQALGVAVLDRDRRGLVEQDDVVPGVADGGGVYVAGVG